jgi:hypothetical protein
MVKKKRVPSEFTVVTEPVTAEETAFVGDLKSCLEEIKTYEGVVGYILRNSVSAAIDLKDPSKIIDYAILSSSSFDSRRELAGLFDLGEVKDVIVEGEEVKMLSLVVGENKISIFVERDADCEKILKKLR